MPFGPWPGGTGSSGLPGEVARVDSIESVGDTLLNFDASRYDNGDVIYVGNVVFPGQGSICDWVRVRRGAGLTPTEGEVWNSLVTAGVQFERLHTPSAVQLQKQVWTVTADDGLGTSIVDNDGFGAFPISMRELNRRRAGDSQGIGSLISIQIPSLLLPARPELLAVNLSNWYGTDGNGAVVLLGIVDDDIYTGTVSAFTTADHAANTGYILEATGIGTAVGGLINCLVQTADESKSAIIQEVLGPDIVRITQPRNGSASAFNAGTIVSFDVNDDIVVPQLPAVPIWPFIRSQLQFPAAGRIDFTGFEAQFNVASLVNSSPFIVNCLINSGGFVGGNLNAVLSVVGWRGFSNLDAATLSMFSCGFNRGAGDVTGRVNIISSGTVYGQDNLDLHDCQLLARGGRLLHDGDLSCFGFADTAPAMVRLDSQGFINIATDWWGGSGEAGGSINESRLAQVSQSGQLTVNRDGITVLTTNSPDDINVIDGTAGVYSRNDISIINPLGGGVTDPAHP